MADRQTGYLKEGDEEVQYLYVTLPSNLDPVAYGPGSVVIIQGLTTEQPTLRPFIDPAVGDVNPAVVKDGVSTGSISSSSSSVTALQGHYVDSVGSILFVKEQPVASHNAKPTFSYVGHTDKQLRCEKRQ